MEPLESSAAEGFLGSGRLLSIMVREGPDRAGCVVMAQVSGEQQLPRSEPTE
jgi:hypothetical protein